MILVDIGNSGLRASRVELGSIFPQEHVYRLSWSAAVASQRKPTPEQAAAPNLRWCSLEDSSAFDWLVSQFEHAKGEPWLVSSVQRSALEKLRSSLHSIDPNSNMKVVSFADVPLRIDVLTPERTGIDRLLAAYCAYRHVNQNESDRPIPVIVIQAGTAVTVDLVGAKGDFLGGSIMPGLGLALQLLAAGTDLLPWLGNHAVDTWPTLPGKNTEQAISAGVNAALVGGASHLVERYRRGSIEPGVSQVIVSGGDGQLLLPHIAGPVEFVEHAVLRGLSYLQAP